MKKVVRDETVRRLREKVLAMSEQKVLAMSEPADAQHGNDANRFLAAHMRGREVGPLPYWGGRWALLVLRWNPWTRAAKSGRE